MLVRVLLLALLLALLCSLAFTQRSYEMVFEKLVKVMIDPMYGDPNTVVRVTRINRTHTVVAGDVELMHEFNDHIKVTVNLYEQLGTEYKRSIGVPIKDKPFCEILVSKLAGLDLFFKSTNLPEKCPVPKGKYRINNYMIDPDRLPIFMPGYKWRIDMIFTHNEIQIAHIQVYLRVEHQGIAKVLG